LNDFHISYELNRVHQAEPEAIAREFSWPARRPYKINSLPLTGDSLRPVIHAIRNGNASTVAEGAERIGAPSANLGPSKVGSAATSRNQNI